MARSSRFLSVLFGLAACGAPASTNNNNYPVGGAAGAAGVMGVGVGTAGDMGVLPTAGTMAMGNAGVGGGAGTGSTCVPGAGAGGTGGMPMTMSSIPLPPPSGLADWTTFGYDKANTRNNTSETKLSVTTVSGLMKRWTVPAGGGSKGSTSTPIVTGGRIYVCEHPGNLVVRDAGTGKELWRKDNLGSVRCGTPLVTSDRVYVSAGGNLFSYALDGTRIFSSPYNVKSALTDGSPVAAGDKIVVGVGTYEVINPPPYDAKGIIVAFDKTGAEKWRWIPASQGGGNTNGISVWSSAAVDEARKLMFIGTGQAYQSPAGPNSDALVAINYDTGAVKWVNQFTANDIYTDANAGATGGSRLDFDIGSSPNLFVAKGIDVVGVGSKGAIFRAINRDTGAVVWERNLGNGSAIGGVMAGSAAANGRIFVAHRTSGGQSSGTAQLRALKMDDGTDAWPAPVSYQAYIWGAVSHANGVVYATTHSGQLAAYDASNGKQLWTTMLAQMACGGPMVSDGWLFVPSGVTGLGPNSTAADLSAFSLPGAAPPGPGAGGGGGAAGTTGGAAGTAAMGGAAGTAAMGGAAGTTGTTDPVCTPNTGAAFAPIATILNNHGCVGGFCHGAAAGLMLQTTAENQYNALVGADHLGAPTGSPADGSKCSGKRRIVPHDLANSVLYQKVTNMATCGTVMPPAGTMFTPLSAQELMVIANWINAGAPFN